MRNTDSKEYLRLLADWQRTNNCSGVPPVSHNKKLSNWIQYCRTAGRRGALRREIADALSALGIRLQRGPTDACSTRAASYVQPRGMVPVLKAAHEHVETFHRVPT